MNMEQDLGQKPEELKQAEIDRLQQQIAERESQTLEDDPALDSMKNQLEELRQKQ